MAVGYFFLKIAIIYKVSLMNDKLNEEYEELRKITLRFNGLCEIISNYVIMNDLIGQPLKLELHPKLFNAVSNKEEADAIEEYIAINPFDNITLETCINHT